MNLQNKKARLTRIWERFFSMLRGRTMLLLCLLGISNAATAQFVVESLNGAVTQNEIAAFKKWATGINLPANWNPAVTQLSYGIVGRDVEAIGLMYEVTGDKALLDVSIKYADKILSIRNNPTTGTFDWTGQRELIWHPEDVRTGTEQGLIVAKITYAAQLILQTPSLWNQTVPDGNPFGYGATYKQRADRYVAEAEKTESTYMIKWLVRASDNDYYFPSDSRYDGGNGGQRIPHNQRWMMNFNKWRMAKCYEILGNATKANQYRAIVQKSLDTYGDEMVPVNYQSQPSYIWYYEAGPTASHTEDIGHAQHGIIGMMYLSMMGGYTGFPDQLRMANAIRYANYQPATNEWNHNVAGTNTTNYRKIQPGFLFLSRYLPELYSLIGNDLIKEDDVAGEAHVTAYILWTKKARNTGYWGGNGGSATINTGNYKIIARHSGSALVVEGASLTDGANVVQWPYGGSSTNDEWNISSTGNGYYKITARHSGKALAVQGASTVNGGNVFQWAYGGASTNDEWAIQNADAGYYRIVNRNSGKVLDVSGRSTANGANIQQWTMTNATNQQFQISGISITNPTTSTTATTTSTSSTTTTTTTTTGSCSGVAQYVNGNSYNTGAVVQNVSKKFQCKVGGWCSIGGAYAPGVGWAWTEAWSQTGTCS